MASSSLYVSFSGFKLKLLLIFVTCLIGITSAQLSNENFYKKNCSGALNIIKEAVKEAVANESRMGASLLRLHFHDCFVQGCDASVLLDDTANFTGEKSSLPNARSIRGLEVIDSIKSKLEDTCPGVVSCADILAVAARDAVVALGGAKWNVPLGRRDSTTANLTESNSDLPGPSLNLSSLIAAFAKKNFNTRELVTLSGAHTAGMVRCNLFRTRIYNESDIDTRFAKEKQEVCPFEGGDFNFTTLDSTTPFQFDNAYYKNLKGLKGLMHSDQQLYGENGVGLTNSQVDRYTKSNANFIQDFAKAMIKMSKMSPLTGTDGEIRKNCRFINPPPTTVS